ncbi:TonB-dependent receptor [Flavobacterium rivuli WB 3.3-2 = DSM 21788]|uniref:TonB-dependent receptor n=1 Tax=Flavobacterium rivuli WB 3.3-2 = DSM 21788 TaxID=1121895 RepID=A0A0A2M6N3_9FLAO|nr:TonB-dependent receptor [Flavobacterium rivuli]KGO87949.1 TonB-dependent receptor [Flavobacterium rivuli WB 3.3-2 = DSM 21788]
MNTFKQILSCLLLLCTFTAWAQDRATLSGTITLSDNTPAENISVALKGTSHASVTSASGTYEIKNVKPGSYILVVSAIGVASVQETITLAAGEKATKNVTLSESQEQLKEVIIEANKASFVKTTSEVVSKMPLKDIENPQVYNTISAEVLKQQVITNFDDALNNAPGLAKLWESTGRGGDGAGYFSLRGFAVQPTMINGVPGLTTGSPDPANIERIEVIKGPSGTLFGSSLISYGGLINVNTKRPYDTFGGNVSYTGGTYGLNRYTIDVNTPLNKEKKVFFRLNAAYHTEDSFQDAGFKKSLFVAPSLSYEVNDKLSFLVNTEFYNGRSTNPTMLFLDRGAPSLKVHNMKELGYDNRRSYTGNDLYIETPTFNFQGQMNYKFSSEWRSQTILSRTSAKSDGYYSYLYEGTQYYPRVTSGIILGRSMNKQNSETTGTDIQQNFIGDFKIGNMRNRVVAGLDYFNRNVVDNSSGYVSNGAVYIGNNLRQFNNEVLGITNEAEFTDDSGILTQAGTDALLATTPINQSKTKQEIYSAYASDVFNFTPALSAMASLRIDHFSNDNGNQTALSPKFGVVYQPILDKLSLFANYMNGFSNTDPTTNTLAGVVTAVSFDPEHANQFEAGAKVNLFNNKVTGSVSYYETKVSNSVYAIYSTQLNPDGTPALDDEGNPLPQNVANYNDGGQKNKGIEFSVTANPVEGLNILAGYSYNDSRLTAGDPTFVNYRPESAGPQNLANLWASYKFSNGILNGFGLGFGGNYASKNKIYNRTNGNFTVSEYTVLNASAFYNVDAFTITLKVDNITDKEYYKGWSTINPQRPRIFAANLSYNF